MADWGRRVLLGSLLGAALGVLVGLGVARLLWQPGEAPPAPIPDPATALAPQLPAATALPATMPPAAEAANERHDEALLVISALYALDGDRTRAEERLAALGLDDPLLAVAGLAQQHAAAGNGQLATDLATLAAALGHEEAELVAYVATATRTATPTSTPAPTLSLTPLPSPSPSPAPSLTATSQPSPTTTPRPPTRQPPTATPLSPVATPLPLVWDHRVDMLAPPVRLVEAEVALGQPYWRLVRLEWWKRSEGGNTLLYVSTFNEQGQPVWGQEVIVENGGHTVLHTSPKAGEYHGTNFPMQGTLNSYQVFAGGDLPSDRVTGLGLGEWHGSTDHTTFVLDFQRTIKR